MMCRHGFIYPCDQVWDVATINIQEPLDDVTLRFQVMVLYNDVIRMQIIANDVTWGVNTGFYVLASDFSR